jgi:hypothetical protein
LEFGGDPVLALVDLDALHGLDHDLGNLLGDLDLGLLKRLGRWP